MGIGLKALTTGAKFIWSPQFNYKSSGECYIWF